MRGTSHVQHFPTHETVIPACLEIGLTQEYWTRSKVPSNHGVGVSPSTAPPVGATLRVAPACCDGTEKLGLRVPLVGLGLCCALLIIFPMAGCVTKAKADAQARAAFLAGQQQTIGRLQQTQGRGPGVIINGPARNPFIPWVAGLTLAQAVVAADYLGPDPETLVILRAGRAILCDPRKLLSGEDVALQPGDVVEFKGAGPGENLNPLGGAPPPPGNLGSPLGTNR